jgi:hypothetical protein
MTKEELKKIPPGTEITGSITKHMDRRFLSSLDFIGLGDVTVTIDRVELVAKIAYLNGDTKSNVKLLYIAESEKPLALCATNIRALITLCGSTRPKDWKGTRVVLHTEKVMAFGKQEDAVRFVGLAPEKK